MLGPILFLIYVNDIPEHVKTIAKMFAFDTRYTVTLEMYLTVTTQ